MKQIFISLLLIALISCKDNHWGVPEEDSVAVLNKDNFEDFVKEHKFVFVKFYAPWCGHCKTMAPGYSKLAKRMMEDSDGIAIAQVDASVDSDLGTKYGVKGFPTLKFFINGVPADYNGGREENEMFNWLKKKTGPTSTEITDLKALEEHASKQLSVLFLHPEEDVEGLKNFFALAAGYDDIPFAHSSNQDFFHKYDVDQKYTLVVFRTFDDGKKFLVSEEIPEIDNLKNFLEAVRFPLVMDFDQKAAERIFGNQAPAIIFFSDDESNIHLNDFKEIAKQRGSDILFTKSTISDALGARLSEFIGIDKSKDPAVRIIKFVGGAITKYVIEDISKTGIDQAIDNFKNDRLTAYFKSADIPETNDEPVKVVVGNSFEDLVINNDKFVLLELYAPWCGHCKQLDPIYTELAAKLAHVENLVIAKMDATANEHSSLNVKGFPTINFYKPGSKSTPETYGGERDLESLLKYLEEQLGKKLVEQVKTEEL